jgi:hypothetical protein
MVAGGDESSTVIGCSRHPFFAQALVANYQVVAPLMTGLSIMPASTPQLVAMVL